MVWRRGGAAAYFVHQDGGGGRQSQEVGGEERDLESGWLEELEGGGQHQVEDDLGEDQGQQDRRLVQGRPVEGQHLGPLEYSSEIFNINISNIIININISNIIICVFNMISWG